MEENVNTDNQTDNKPWLWKKGQSGNPKGRPKGKTLKEYTKEYLACMTEEERENFLDGLPKELIWKMAEGNPSTDTTLKGDIENPIPILNVSKNSSHNKDNEPDQEDQGGSGRDSGVQNGIDNPLLDSFGPERHYVNPD